MSSSERRRAAGSNVAPETTITGGPTGLTNQTAANFTFTSTQPAATFECKLDTPAGAGTYSTCSSPASYTTTANGNWTFTVRPTINTVYQSRWRTNDSSAVTLKVRPAIRLTRAGSRFTARVTAAQSFTRKTIVLQRYRAALRRWATLRRVTLSGSTTPTAGTFVTTAKFRSQIRRGWRLRVLLPQGQAGTCYLAAPSNTLRVR